MLNLVAKPNSKSDAICTVELLDEKNRPTKTLIGACLLELTLDICVCVSIFKIGKFIGSFKKSSKR